MQAILEQNRIAESLISQTNGEFGSKIGLMGKVFGCWHTKLGRPFTHQKDSYRSCLNCGARKHFDTQSLRTSGPFFYPPSISFEEGKK